MNTDMPETIWAYANNNAQTLGSWNNIELSSSDETEVQYTRTDTITPAPQDDVRELVEAIDEESRLSPKLATHASSGGYENSEHRRAHTLAASRYRTALATIKSRMLDTGVEV